MKFGYRFRVRAPLAAVARFHQRAESLVKLTPPPARVELETAPERPREGDLMSFTISLGPLEIPWTAEFSEISANGFTDSQLRGPYQRWVHRHRFRPLNEGATIIEDQIDAVIGLTRWAPVALALWLSLPLLFRHRRRVTRQALEVADA